MLDIFPDSAFKLQSVADFKVHNMILFPRAWAGFKATAKLDWKNVPFSLDGVKRVPKDAGGVYTFVVQLGIANHPACSYLLYVGKAGKSFQERYRDYLAVQRKGESGRRPHIYWMLKKWEGYLWFYYAAIRDESDIVKVEDALITAYLPPTNVEMPGILRKKMALVFGT